MAAYFAWLHFSPLQNMACNGDDMGIVRSQYEIHGNLLHTRQHAISSWCGVPLWLGDLLEGFSCGWMQLRFQFWYSNIIRKGNLSELWISSLHPSPN